MTTRLYGLFLKPHGSKKWERLKPSLAFKKTSAIKIFQSTLIDGDTRGELRLRPIPVEKPTTMAATMAFEHEKNCAF